MECVGASLKRHGKFIDFVLGQWLVLVAGAGLVLSSVLARRLPAYSSQDLEVLLILLVLLVVVNGLQASGLVARIARGVEHARAISVRLVLTTFFLSMLVTNDVALIVMVSLTLSLHLKHKDWLVILEALAANAGSALTPIGNPQNLYLYWFYHLGPMVFMKTMAPFAFLGLALLLIAAHLVPNRCRMTESDSCQEVDSSAWGYAALLGVVLLTVFRILPVATCLLILLGVALVDRRALRVDYPLMVSFLFFFGMAENLKVLLASEMGHAGHVFVLSALASQVMSNVPATLLFARFTENWHALLWGVNVGGFGSLLGSLANLIAYRMYLGAPDTEQAGRFTVRFLAAGYAAFCLSMGWYFLLYRPGL